MVWNCTYMANYYTRIRVFFCNFALAFGKASHGLTAPRSPHHKQPAAWFASGTPITGKHSLTTQIKIQ